MSEEEYIDDLDYIAGIVKQNKKLIEENVQLQQVNKQLKEELEKKNKMYWQQQCSYYSSILYSLEEWLKEKLYEIEPKVTGINFNCEYDSEEDYVRGMETKSKLDTLKNSLNKIQELKEKYKIRK